jgi:hypothetical protein
MKKQFFLLSFALFLLLMSCNFQIPSAVQIKGSPDFKFSAKFDIGKNLKEFFNESDFAKDNDDIKLLDCVNTGDVTYLVYMTLYNDALDLSGLPNTGSSFITPNRVNLVQNKSIDVPAMDFNSSFDGFSFDDGVIKSNLYISGSPIMNCLSVELKINGETQTRKSNHASGIDSSKTIYDGNGLPAGGASVELPFNGEEVTINYSIFIAAGEEVKTEWLNASDVLIELAVWLPFVFTAKNDGAELKLPEDLFPEGDLFGREKSGDDNSLTEMLESINFAMKMNKNPFTGAALIVKSREIEIIDQMKGDSLGFLIDEKTMKAINSADNFPFSPQLKLVFNKGGKVSFPRDLTITEISFSAKLNHTIDLQGGGN